LEYLITLYGT
jgi:quinolinate synthase